ncbi:MAG: hypothetical protein ACP5QG_04205 [candidate division WOR-3 bacterium]
MGLLFVEIGLSLLSAQPAGATDSVSEIRGSGASILGKNCPAIFLCSEKIGLTEVNDEAVYGLVPSFALEQAQSESGVLPFYDGGGWIPPSLVCGTAENERFPSVAVDATGNIWATVLVGEYPHPHIGVFRSTDKGFTWNHVLGIYNSYDGPVGPPAIFVDPGPSPNIVYLAFSSFWKDNNGTGHTGLEIASFASDRPSETFRSVWVANPATFNLSEASLSVERGHGPDNTAFVLVRAVSSLTGAQYLWVFRGSRYGSWSKVLTLGGTRRYIGSGEIWSTDRATYLICTSNPDNSLPDEAKRIHILTTQDRGQSWNAVYADAPYPVVEVAIAGAQGRNQAVAFAALKYGKSDHDVYAFYTTDLGSTWGGYWMDTDNQDSRLPRVSSDGVQFDAGASAVFYFIEYYDRENDGLGNIKFLMCPVGDIAERSNWRLPNGSSLDSLVISNESLYGVEPVRGCLSLSSRSESGGTMPVVVWNTPCISLSGDVYFVRPMAPVYMGAEEEDGHAQEIRVFFVPAERALRIDGDLHGETRLRLYSVDGRLVASLGLSPEGKTTTVKLPDLPEGVYLWRILQTGGRVSVIR